MPALPNFLPWGRTSATVPATTPAKPENPFRVERNVKSEDLASRIRTLLGDYDSLGTSTGAANTSYLNRFNASTPLLERQNAEDVSYLTNLGRQLPGALADMRARRRDAVAGAADKAVGDLRRTLSLNQLGRGGGMSSYLARLGLKNAGAIRTQQALDDANQERSDFDFATKLRQALVGQRQGLTDSLTNRELASTRGQDDRFNQLAAALSKLLSLDQSNNFIGLSAEA